MVTHLISLILGADPQVALRVGKHPAYLERWHLERKSRLILMYERTAHEVVAEHAVDGRVEEQAVVQIGVDIFDIGLVEERMIAYRLRNLAEPPLGGVVDPA